MNVKAVALVLAVVVIGAVATAVGLLVRGTDTAPTAPASREQTTAVLQTPTAGPSSSATATEVPTPSPAATPPSAVTPTETPITTKATPAPTPAAIAASFAQPISATVQTGEETVLDNQAGAQIVIPAAGTTGAETVTITEADPPETHVEVGRVFDFTLVDKDGNEVELQQPVTISLPYELPEGKDHSDVVVLHWNEDLEEWEYVEGETVDAASQTITVTVTDLSDYAPSWLLTLAEFIEQSAEFLIDTTFGQDYEDGSKHLVALKAGGGVHKVNGDISLILDVDDLLRITDEGKDGYVTSWVNITAGLGSVSWGNSLPVGIYFFTHDRTGDADDDPRFKATFKSLSGSVGLGYHVVEVGALTATRGKINPVSGSYKVCLTCTPMTASVGLSWADLTWNAKKGELKVRSDDDLHDILYGRLGPDDGGTVELSPEIVASEVIGALFEAAGGEIRALFEESAPFTSFDSPSPAVVAGWDDSLHNQITGHCGGFAVFGQGGNFCVDGDMVFPSHADAEGEPVAEIPMRLLVKGDLRETKDYFVKLLDLTPGWRIERDSDGSLWSDFVTWVLYDDRSEFETKPGKVHAVPYLVGNRPGAPNPGVATFELVHVRGAKTDVLLDRYRIELWNDREVSDLSVEASGTPYTGAEGEGLIYTVTVSNAGPDPAKGVTLHVDVPDRESVVFTGGSASGNSEWCGKSPYFGRLTCDLRELEVEQSTTLTLEYDPPASLQEGETIEAQFHVTSRVYDPSKSHNLPYNNKTTATIEVNLESGSLVTKPELMPPSDDTTNVSLSREFVSVSAGSHYTCGVRTDGSIVCWGSGEEGRATPPAGEFLSVSAGHYHTCGVREDGSVACWGLNRSGQATPPGGRFLSVSAAYKYTCGVREDSSVACWGWDQHGAHQPPDGKFASVSAGFDHTCGVKLDGSVVCWGRGNKGQTTPPSGGLHSVSAGTVNNCGIRRSDASVVCWGEEIHGAATPPDGEFASISAAGSYTCAVRTDGSVACWGNNDYGQATPPAGEFLSVSAGNYHTCGVRVDGSVACWGRNTDGLGKEVGQATPPDGGLRSVSAGTVNNCGIRKSDASVVCWGEEIHGAATPPDGEFASISAAGSYTCAVRTDGSVACWGNNDYGRATPPAGEFLSVSAGNYHTCGVRVDGSVACWGRNTDGLGKEVGQATPPGGEFVSVSAGSHYTCGVRTDGSIVCWGSGEEGRATPPAGEFLSVSAGHYHSCGVREDGSVACWGLNRSGQATPPRGRFLSVSAAYKYTCGVREDSSVACWGWDQHGAHQPPDGKFASVSAGFDHTCGVKLDGSVVCWGRGNKGQTTPPSGSTYQSAPR